MKKIRKNPHFPPHIVEYYSSGYLGSNFSETAFLSTVLVTCNVFISLHLFLMLLLLMLACAPFYLHRFLSYHKTL